MKALVTGSSGHLGEALVRTLRSAGHATLGIDIRPSPFTDRVASITDRGCLRGCLTGVDTVFHTATLHKPHLATHGHQAFVDTNITGTLNLLEEAVIARIKSFIYTSTTSVFGAALVPTANAAAVWVTEALTPIPKNIYGVTKLAAENLCQLFHRKHRLACIVLRTSRFFPEKDDSKAVRDAYVDENMKVNEYLYRRADLEDIVEAHLLAARNACRIGFGCFVLSAPSPFVEGDLQLLRSAAPAVVRRRVPEYEMEYARRGWKMLPGIDRVYVSDRACLELGWHPKYDFRFVVENLQRNQDFRSPLARGVGSKGYHTEQFTEGPYPVES